METGGGFREAATKTRRPLAIPARIATAAELDALIRRLHSLRIDIAYTEFDIVVG